MQTYIIVDWTGRPVFSSIFSSFEEAEDFLIRYFDRNQMDYNEWRDEYVIDCIGEEKEEEWENAY